MLYYDARVIIGGMLYDAKRLLDDGQVKQAYKVLLRKVRELERLETAEYAVIRWE